MGKTWGIVRLKENRPIGAADVAGTPGSGHVFRSWGWKRSLVKIIVVCGAREDWLCQIGPLGTRSELHVDGPPAALVWRWRTVCSSRQERQDRHAAARPAASGGSAADTAGCTGAAHSSSERGSGCSILIDAQRMLHYQLGAGGNQKGRPVSQHPHVQIPCMRSPFPKSPCLQAPAIIDRKVRRALRGARR